MDKYKPHTALPLPHACRRATCGARGFTLIELLTTIAVVAIISNAALPYMGKLIDSMRMRTIATDFLSSLHMARSEAIKRNTRVAVCTSSDGTRCATSGGWEQGWIVFHDADNDGIADTGEQVVQHRQALPAGFAFSGNMNVDHYISFTPTGMTRTAGGAFQAGTITLCKRSGSNLEGREVVINNVGRTRIQKVAVPACA